MPPYADRNGLWDQPGPVVLLWSEGWEAIECDRLVVRGRAARLVARQGDKPARLEFV
jgi:hypothetical protein